MADIIRFTGISEFAQYNESFISKNTLLYYHLKNTIIRVKEKRAFAHNYFNVIDKTCHLAVLHIDGECLIYADEINDDVILKLSEGLKFHLFKRHEFFGTKPAIDALFKLHNIVFQIQKHRNIYKCENASAYFTYPQGEMQVANEKYINELILFNIMFQKSYFGLKQERDAAARIIYQGIHQKNLFQWEYANRVCSIAQVILGEHDFPVIGHVFTNPDYRGRNYATSIVYKLTKQQLDNGHKFCMLATDANNPASNAAFIKAGYKITGEYMMAFKKK